jgi:hypothetical protein
MRDRFFVHLVRGQGGELVAVAPLVLTERPGAGPLRSRNVAFFGSDKSMTELRGLICPVELEGPVTSALLAHLVDTKDDWDWLMWSGVSKNGPAYQALNEIPGFEWSNETIDHVLPLPSTWAEFRHTRSRNIKESLRKCYNSLKRDGHRFTFHVVSDPKEMPSALRRFFELHVARARARGLVPHADVFFEHRARRLMLDLAAAHDGEPSLRIFQLQIEGQVVAARLAFALGDELYLYFSGYDPAWATYSVMTTTVAEAIKWAIENRFKVVNLSPGTDVSKTRWGGVSVVKCNGALISPTRRAKSVFLALSELKRRSRPGTLLGKVLDGARRVG